MTQRWIRRTNWIAKSLGEEDCMFLGLYRNQETCAIIPVRIFSHRVMLMMLMRIILRYILYLPFNSLIWRHLESLMENTQTPFPLLQLEKFILDFILQSYFALNSSSAKHNFTYTFYSMLYY